TVTGGTYGRSIDGETLAQTIVDDLNAGTSASVDIPMLQEDAVYATQGQPDWGPSYVDVDLTNQHVRYYDASGTLVWESDCVSGDTTEDHGTPEGVYAITSYMSSGNVKLTGATDTATGEPEYISYVDYWMPFIGNGYALHDASWRSSFGGTVYEGNGSHGCVNLPSSKAAELYGMVSVGTPVVVHY
ncbi:MAG: L,D-transpeptidase, partial [Atopobiaceae bacterium]|nr:L,D-transpeptidase [Atopobiaceae bacterium]